MGVTLWVGIGGPKPVLPPRLCAQGLERTEHEGFGGGNTAWEEEKLAKYQHRWVSPSWGVWEDPAAPGGRVPTLTPCPCSETRLLEVLESVCAPSDFTCHQLLERSEEHVERWWFHE